MTFTTEQLRASASRLAYDLDGCGEYSAMLRQAASDREDAERYRLLTSVIDAVSVTHGALTMTIKPAPYAKLLLNAFLQGALACDLGTDQARQESRHG